MDINLIQTKPNEYAYLNDIELTVIETNSDALCPPESTIKEIISRESHLAYLNRYLERRKKEKFELKIDIIFHEILNTIVYGGAGFLYFMLASSFSTNGLLLILTFYYLISKGLHLTCCGTRIGKCKKFKKFKEQIKLNEEEIEKHQKEIEQLKNEIGYNVTLQMSREEYERRCRIWELERNNKLPNTKYNIYNNEFTLEKYLTIGQKKRKRR